MERKRLSDILHNGNRDDLARKWDETAAADDFGPLPPGEYVARIISGELFTSKTKGTPGYKLTFRILEGDHAGRRFWHDLWLTGPAVPRSKRDAMKLGVKTLSQLDGPLPTGIRCRVKLALHRNDNGAEYNKVQHFKVLAIDAPEEDAFAPADEPSDPPAADGSAGGFDDRF